MQRVLIFGEDRNLLEICTLILSSIELQVFSKNSRSVLEDVKLAAPDIILMDSPNLSEGKNIISQVRSMSEFGNIPVIFLSGHNEMEGQAKRTAIDFCLQKPFNLKDLEDHVNMAIEASEKGAPKPSNLSISQTI